MDTQEAFDTLLRQLHQASKEAQAAGARAFQNGRFDEAQAAAQRGQEITARIQQIEALKREWPRLVQGAMPATPAQTRTGRLSRGQKTSRQDFYLPILAALEEMGGRGRVREVLDRVELMVRDRLRSVDWEPLSDGRSVRWRNTAQWARHDMIQNGLLASDSPQGVWEITEAGLGYLREHRAKPR